MSSFGALNLGARAIFAAQRGLDITGQNIANSATPGYSRQRVDQVAVGGPTVPAIWSKYDETGGGVKVTGISRMRDEFLEARARTAHSALGQLNEQTKTYEAIERTIDEPSDTGLKKRLNEFWNSWADAGNDLKAEGPGRVVVERGVAVADQINHMATQLETQWADTRTELQANADAVNSAAADIAKLNKAIRNNTISGLPANELADQRDLLVEKITTLTGGVAVRDDDGMVNITMPGTPQGAYLVEGMRSATVQVSGESTYEDYLAAGGSAAPVTIEWATDLAGDTMTGTILGGASDLNPKGTMNGQLAALNQTLPKYLDHLDGIAAQIAATVNTQQAAGWTTGGDQGEDLFSPVYANAAADPLVPTARAAINLRFTGAATGLAISSVDPAGGAINGDNAKAMMSKTYEKGGADDQLRAMVVQLGVDAESVYRNKSVFEKVARTADDARDSVSGVSLNEEMTNLMKYQHSFAAAAKFITAVDATIESLLNMTR